MMIRPFDYLLISGLMLAVADAGADAVDEAKHLLLVTDTGAHFESIVRQQTRDIIRTYASILSTSAEVTLPRRVRSDIAACYADVYAWERFQPGIAQILAENFSRAELRLLTDFFRGRGLPPMEIETFRNVVARAERIQRICADYIYANSGSCVERDAELIRAWLDGHAPIDDDVTVPRSMGH